MHVFEHKREKVNSVCSQSGRRKAQGSLSFLLFSIILSASSNLVPMHSGFLNEEEDDKKRQDIVEVFKPMENYFGLLNLCACSIKITSLKN